MELPRRAAHYQPPADLTQAAVIQRALATEVNCTGTPDAVNRIVGVDVSNNPYDPSQLVYGVMVGLTYPGLKVVDRGGHIMRAAFPYVPGFLAFREIPVLLEAFQQLREPPDLIMVDGHGISHPRGLGIASHLGVLLDIPTIGVAKSRLVGYPAGEVGPEPGDTVPLLWKNRQIGVVLRSKRRANPLFIAPGHQIGMDAAVEWVLKCLAGYRLPEPTRQAHLAANVLRKSQAQPTG